MVTKNNQSKVSKVAQYFGERGHRSGCIQSNQARDRRSDGCMAAEATKELE